jgi:hypothetical protein
LTDYPPALPDRYLALPEMYWTQDSSKLSLVLPAPKTNFGYSGPELRSVWQYSLEGSTGVEIHLNPHPVGEAFSISPDGKWIAYSYYYVDGKTNATDKFGVYLGNLDTGTSQLLDMPGSNEVPTQYKGWSPDSAHFIFEGASGQMYAGNIHGDITVLNGGGFLGWIDGSRYLYGKAAMAEIGKERHVRVAELPASMVFDEFQSFTFIFVRH